MKEIKNLAYFQELNTDELNRTRGGIFWFLVGGVVLAITREVLSDWDNFKAGLMGQPEIKY